MKIRRFVCGSSIILAGWLGATFLNEVPSQRYPKLDKSSGVTSLPKEEEPASIATHLNPTKSTDSSWR